MSPKRILTGLFLVFSICALSGFIKIDEDPLKKIAAELEKWFTEHHQEKVYLQLDKPYYAIGDDIWFKAYITTGPNHELSGLSGVLNVDLIDDRDSIKRSIKLPAQSGITWGDFALSDSLKEGNYRIRAYTNIMRNQDDGYFFEKTITIVNSIKNNVFTKTAYSFTIEAGQQKVNALINYIDLEGNPYTNAQVNYDVRLGDKSIHKGKGQTDAKGNLDISFLNTNIDLLKQGRIITNIKLADKSTVTKSVLIKAVSGKVDVQFFPEGGNLVIGNFSKIAFKAVASTGLGAEVKGTVVDEQNNVVVSFNSTHLGMGFFYLKPEEGKIYKARLTYADGSENTMALPVAVNTGYSLNVVSSGSNLRIRIVGGPAVLINNNETATISLVAQSGGVIYYAARSKPGNSFLVATVEKSKFPTGIVQFTLFSPTGEPLNERLVFVNNNDQMKLNVTTEKQTYSPREKVKIDLNANNEKDKPMVGTFSVAVTDETKVPVTETGENTILSNLLLTSDLKGYVEKPGYYFESADETSQADLDVLMLTQGYRRFEWKQIVNNSYPPSVFQPEKALQISGHIRTPGGKPIVNGKVNLFSNVGGVFFLDTVSDNEGRFVFKNLVFKDSIKFVVQARNAKDKKSVEIEVDKDGPNKVTGNKNAPDFQVNYNDALMPFLNNSKRMYTEQLKYGINNNLIQLREVVIKEQKESKVKDSQNLNGPGNADQVIKAEDIEKFGCADIAQCLESRLTGVIYRNGNFYSTRNNNYPMAIELDGLITDSSILSSISPQDVGSVEVLRSAQYTSIYGSRGGGGLIIITTKRGGGDYHVQRYTPYILAYSPKGYYRMREFYSPKYDDPKTNTNIPDLRSTIFWKPNVVTHKDGKASVEFFNADGKGTYRVVVEGIDEDGNLGRQVYRYKVQ